ncbi:uncharacterized protein si:dkey-284p5.3 isoform X2 [Heptranchias perlo]|uniref:uncharacterized protein si:dkey-284p5.3 isoform X2 n=1 Tax=Heptranchias perlo TaxID=212740 RepID=UPI00355AA606
MGCSTSTQTQLQDSNRPSSKLEERNAANKCAPDINGPIADESETIPDQSQLLEPKRADTVPDEVVTSEPSPSEVGGVLEMATEDCNSSVPAEMILEEPEIPAAPMEETSPSDADDITEVQASDTGKQTEESKED